MKIIFETEHNNMSVKLYETQTNSMNMGRMVGVKDCTIITFPYTYKYSDYHSFKDSKEFLMSLLAKKLGGKRNAQSYARKIAKHAKMLDIPVEAHELFIETAMQDYLSDEFVLLPVFANSNVDTASPVLSKKPMSGYISKQVGWAYVARSVVKDKDERLDDFTRNFLKITIERELEELNALISGRDYYASFEIGGVKYNLPIIYADKASAIGMVKAYFERISKNREILEILAFDTAVEYYNYSENLFASNIANIPEEFKSTSESNAE